MSMTIYTGFKLKANTIEEAYEIAEDFRLKANEIAEEETIKWIAREAAHLFDEATLAGQEPELTRKVSEARYDFMRTSSEQDRKQSRDFSGVDMTSEIVIFPTDKGIVGILYTENSKIEDAWKSLPEVEDFSYWNNSDHPEDVLDEEWEERSRVWNKVFESRRGSIPSSALRGITITFTLNQQQFLLDRELVNDFWPTMEERVGSMARGRVIKRITSQLAGNTSGSSSWSVYARIGDYIRSEEGVEEISREAEKIRDVLESDLTQRLLWEGREQNEGAARVSAAKRRGR